MENKSRKRRLTCMDEILYCQKCGKIVKQGIFNIADYFRCELNHITCAECKTKYPSKCFICGLPYIIEELKTLF